MQNAYNDRIRQVILLVVIIGLALLIFFQLYGFFPGFLGAVTLYILSRDAYRYLTVRRKWKKSLAAVFFLLIFVVCVGLPIYISVQLLSGRIARIFDHSSDIVAVVQSFGDKLREWTGQDFFSQENIKQVQKTVTGFLPALLNSGASMLGNLVMLLFLSYFMFTNGDVMEDALQRFIPLREDNIDRLAAETKNMVRANAIGIPLISIIQGVTAMLGYWIFGVRDFVLWGFLTGLFAFFPIVGTMVVWVPLVVFVFTSGHTGQGIGLTLYSLLATGNIDYVARITLLKKIGDVHPVVTVLGVIVGLSLFGFWGFIFGPLLISYLLLLYNIYNIEFGTGSTAKKI